MLLGGNRIQRQGFHPDPRRQDPEAGTGFRHHAGTVRREPKKGRVGNLVHATFRFEIDDNAVLGEFDCCQCLAVGAEGDVRPPTKRLVEDLDWLAFPDTPGPQSVIAGNGYHAAVPRTGHAATDIGIFVHEWKGHRDLFAGDGIP